MSMGLDLYILFFAVSFTASAAGAICGIGGGVLMKPLLDAFHILSVASINLLSGCTVLSMSCYSVVRARRSKGPQIDRRTGTPLAVGAAVGGIAGKVLFGHLSGLYGDQDRVGAVQAACLLAITLGTMLYTVRKEKIKTHHVTSPVLCSVIGLALGVCSSFLGIGGGPINLVVLYFFFSMETKTAAQNSLYIILFSQAASLLSTLASGSVPEAHMGLLVLMVSGGISGGMAGRKINERISAEMVERLFIGLMVLILLVCAHNICQFL